MPNYGSINVLRRDGCERLKGIRDELFRCGRLPSQNKRADLSEEVRKLERELRNDAGP